MACFFYLSPAEFFGMLNSLDPDQAQSYVWSDRVQTQQTTPEGKKCMPAFLSSAYFFFKINLFQKSHRQKSIAFAAVC